MLLNGVIGFVFKYVKIILNILRISLHRVINDNEFRIE